MPRLDSELVSRGIARSRERAKEMIKSGAVTVNGITAKKPSDNVSENDNIISTEKEIYVGRGALKLQKAAEAFNIDFSGKICIDIGASTGGFTEYMLMHGAEKVYAVDVGKGQLAEKLRNDSRVINMENTDIRNVTEEDTGGQADFICADVSFISLEKILPDIYRLLKNNACAAVLIKPQFEAGRKDIGKGGIVKDRKVHERILSDLCGKFAQTGFSADMLTHSPVKGGSGNIEYLALLKKSDECAYEYDFGKIVNTAFTEL
ncbi:MAG: TlyA family RNA methyltransferase [Ruminococcus sp.]|nr:TlyA family RNA methyltransferase [Ruminococcus sp.]